MPSVNLTENRLRSIINDSFLKYPIKNGVSANDGLIVAYEKASLTILEELLGGPPEKHKDGRLSGIIKARTRLAYFLPYSEPKYDKTVVGERRFLIYILFIYEQWIKSFEYLRDHYAELPDDKFRLKLTLKNINALLDTLVPKFAKMKQQVAEERELVFRPAELVLANELLDVALAAMLGNELYKQFVSHFHTVVRILNEYQQKLLGCDNACSRIQ